MRYLGIILAFAFSLLMLALSGCDCDTPAPHMQSGIGGACSYHTDCISNDKIGDGYTQTVLCVIPVNGDNTGLCALTVAYWQLNLFDTTWARPIEGVNGGAAIHCRQYGIPNTADGDYLCDKQLLIASYPGVNK